MIAHHRVVELDTVRRNCQHCDRSKRCIPAGLAPAEVIEFSNAIRRVRVLAAGEPIFGIGDGGGALYAVRSGSFKVYTLGGDGEEQVLGFYLPGEVLGLDVTAGRRHTCTAVALETSSLCELAFERVEDLSRTLPGLLPRMNRFYAQEIIRSRTLACLLGSKTAEQRLVWFLLDLSERLAARGFSAHEFNLSMSRNDIGRYLGLAVETVSRLFTRLQDDKLLCVERRHVRLLDHAALCERAGQALLQPVAGRLASAQPVLM